MIDLKLRENEGVILQESRIGNGKMFGGFNDQLILTNLNIIYITRNVFGKVNEIKKLPLSKIKNINNEPQVVTTKNPSTNLYQIQIFLTTEQLVAEFSSGGKREINKWQTAIKKQIKLNEKQGLEDLEIEKEEFSVGDIIENQIGEVSEKIGEAKEVFDNVQGKIKKRKGIILKICRIYFLLMFAFFGLAAFGGKQILSGMIALIQIGLLVFTIFIEKGKISEKFVKYRIPAIILSFVLFLPCVLVYNPIPVGADEYDWTEIELCEVIPEPQSNLYDMLSNSNEDLSLYVYEISKDDFKKYIEKCKEFGFTIESNREDNSYFAYNKEGYELTLCYDSINEKMDIVLAKTMELGNIIWPKNDLVALLPNPETSTGKIEKSNSETFRCFLGEMSKSDLESYINECTVTGFSIDSERADGYYKAKNENGDILTLEYKGNCVVYLVLEASKTQENIEETECSTEEDSTIEETTEIETTELTTTENNLEENSTEDAIIEEDTEIETEEETEYVETVWIPSSGTKYHSHSSCSGMKNPSKVSKSDAVAWGYSPCGRCY